MLLSSCPSMIIIQLVSSRSAMMGRNIHHKETNFPSFVLSHHTDKSPDFWGKIQDFVLFWDGKSDKVCALCSVYKAFIIFVSGIQCVSLVKRKLLNYSTFGAGWPYHKSARGAKSFELVRASFHFLSQERVAMCRQSSVLPITQRCRYIFRNNWPKYYFENQIFSGASLQPITCLS